MPVAATAREHMCAGGEIPHPPPWALFLASGRLTPQPPTTPLRRRASPTMLRLCHDACPRTPPPCRRAPTAAAEHAAGAKHPSFHLHISVAEEGNDLGADHRAPEPSTYSTNINPSRAWRQFCKEKDFFLREGCLRESTFNWSLDQMLWRKGRKPQSISHSSPSQLAGAMKHNHDTVSLMQHQQC